MIDIENIRIKDYDYPLPENRIAKYPLEKRDKSKLLIYKDGKIREDIFGNIGDSLPAHSLLIFNNTRVIQARLQFRKETGARVEVFCLEPREPADYSENFGRRNECIWLCMVGNAKKWKDGKLSFKSDRIELGGPAFELIAEKIESFGETHLIRFSWNNPSVTFAEILESFGELPIPPYLNRKTEEGDKNTYQTVYSRIEGSVAAPTAGLHFTETVFDSLKEKNIDYDELTLHVGAGTFKPVKSETIDNHEMHAEFFTVRKSLIEKLLHNKGNIIAVGTTSVRTLESLYYAGALISAQIGMNSLTDIVISQWMPYQPENNRLSVEESLNAILSYMECNHLEFLNCHTHIMIVPGYEFRIVSGIITNFHQPKSTLLLLVSAFLKGKWDVIYDYALTHDFRFLSYGDSSLLLQ